MFDGLYQSLICFFMPYLLYSPATFANESGLSINDRTRMGILVASSAVVASNTYIMLNTYRWDWLAVLINVISSLLIFTWTGIYSSVPSSGQFYKAGSEVYGALSFWVVLLLTVAICLLPRFCIKAVQKVFFPLDVDIIREQLTQGKFDHLEGFQNLESLEEPSKDAAASGGSSDDSATSSDLGKPVQPSMKQDPFIADEERPFYPPSVAPTANTHNARSQNGSNGTNASSFDTTQHPHPQTVDYVRRSADRTRHSFEATHDFPSANMLSRVESSNSGLHAQSPPQSPHSPLRGPYDPPTHPV